MGAYLHFVYVATRSIWMPMLLHVMNNGIGVALLLLVPADKLDQPIPLVVPLAALAVMIFGSAALWTSRAKLEPVPGDDATWYDDTEWTSDWKPEYPGVSAPPPEADVRVGYAVVSPAALTFAVASLGILGFLVYRFVL
jgi:uncharacterized protein